MGRHIQTMADCWPILFACVLFVSITQVHSQGNDIIPITLVDGATQKGAVCIDGSPAGYHHAPGSGDGANNWLVFLMGGGWCGNYTCRLRRGQFHGSTNGIKAELFGGILSSNQKVNPDFYNWNRVFVRYCDGASFLGDLEADDAGTNVQLRGSRIFSAVMDELLAKGMKNADNAILAGSSAGGLATILHYDGFRALLPNTGRVKCIPDSGFFLRAKDFFGGHFREAVFASTIAFHNLTDFLPKSCTSRMNSSLCFFPEYLVGDIQTPLFLLNSALDIFQIQYTVNETSDPNWSTCKDNLDTCTPAGRQVFKGFRDAFFEELKAIGDNLSRGMFINSCYSHVYLANNSMWNSNGPVRLENKTISQAIGDWYFDRSLVKLIDTQIDFPINCTLS